MTEWTWELPTESANAMVGLAGEGTVTEARGIEAMNASVPGNEACDCIK